MKRIDALNAVNNATMPPDMRDELQYRIDLHNDDDSADDVFDVLDALIDLHGLCESVAACRDEDAKTRKDAKRDFAVTVRLLAAAGFYRPITDAGIAAIKSRTVSIGAMRKDVEFPKDDTGTRYTSDNNSLSVWLNGLE